MMFLQHMVHHWFTCAWLDLWHMILQFLSASAIKQRPTAKLLCSAAESRPLPTAVLKTRFTMSTNGFYWFSSMAIDSIDLHISGTKKYSTFRVCSSSDSLHHCFGFDKASNFIIHCSLTSLEILHQEVTVGVQRSSCRCQRFHSSQDVLAVGFGISSFALKKKTKRTDGMGLNQLWRSLMSVQFLF